MDQDQPKEKNKLQAKATGDLDKVTDYVEERDLDTTKVADSMRAIIGNASASKRAGQLKEHMNVKVQKSDISLIADELDVDHKRAEEELRNCGGDVVKALCNLLH